MNQKASQKIILSFVIFIVVVIVFFLFKDKTLSQFFPQLEPEKIPVVMINNREIVVEIADTQEERQKGLMFRESLATHKGMIFIFEEERELSFWMKNTLIPLDIIFISKQLEIVDIKRNAQPCKQEPCEFYTSSQPAKYVLEVNSGYTQIYNINPGDKVELDIEE